MIINYIIIYDYINQKINKYNFTDQTNILVSETNTIGKSSLMKSIYYCLGFNIKVWPTGWDSKQMVFQIKVSKNNRTHLITRQKDLFYIDEQNEILTEKEFSLWLQEFISLNIKLKDKKSKSLVDVYSSEVLLPFYIDQDKSWNGFIFSKTSDSFSRYSNTVTSVIDFFFGINNNKIVNLEIEKNNLEGNLNNVTKKIEAFALLQNENLQFTPPVYKIDHNENIQSDTILNSDQINYHLSKINNISNNISEINRDQLSIETKINNANREISELTKLKQEYRKKFIEIKHVCVHCNSKLTKEQSLTRLKLRNNNLEINEQLDLNKKSKKNYELKLKEIIERKNNLLLEGSRLEDITEKNKQYTDLNYYIEDRVKQEFNNKYFKIEQELVYDKNELISNISNLRKDIIKEKKRGSELKKTIKKSYDELINEYERFFKDIKLDDIKFYTFKEVTGSGIDSNKKMLALYTLYANLISQFSPYNLPFAMDSFIKNETAINLKQQMFSFLSKYYLSINNQVFFSIIKENIQYINNTEDYNFINLDKPILQDINEDNRSLLNSLYILDMN
ncbi:hypothetical protein NSQ54_03425 [Alkalihalobacillus sp. FSL W8-0930]